jgi:DNA repair exonuclease SbcCD nuclease subunit
MKIALLADTHFGIHKGHPAFADNMSSFLRQIFFPYLRSHGIINIIHLGDLVDSRRGISFQTLNRITTDFIHPIIDNHLGCYILAGNHDAPYKNSLECNAVREILRGYVSNFQIIDGPSVDSVFGKAAYDKSFIMMPWICEDNKESACDLLKETRLRVVFGHFQLNGYAMHAGRTCEEGEDDAKLQDFDLVVSGHFHERSRKGVVQYLGAPCEYTWADAGCKRGFGVLDTDTLTIEYIENPFTMFTTLVYDNGLQDVSPCDTVFPTSNVFNKMVRVVVKSKMNQLDFDRAIKEIEDSGPLSLKIIDSSIDMMVDDIDIDESYDENPTKIFGDFLGSMQNSVGMKKKEVENILVKAYNTSYTI